MEKTHLVQLQKGSERRIAVVDEPNLIFLKEYSSIFELALAAIDAKKKIKDLVVAARTKETINYDTVYNGNSEWKLSPSFSHPVSPLHCMVSGTGLTHKNSALNRQLMHKSDADKLTDSMHIYQWGVEGGNPPEGAIGVQPEWFYKGNGSALRAHGQTLEVPSFGNDGGEEPELAAAYVIDREGNPFRIGFTTANEFSDHVMEKKNYLYLAPSKLRECSIGPELVVDADFTNLEGTVSVSRNNEILWQSPVNTGEKNMAHNLSNLEYHHFKYPGHRIPLQAHVHFFGADAFSFGQQIKLIDGDEMSVEWKGMGRPLINYLKQSGEKESLVKIASL